MPYLRAYLAGFNASLPWEIGRRFHFLGAADANSSYCSGGAGIILSREALRLLGVRAEADASVWAGPSSGPEDYLLARTLMGLNIFPVDTRDEKGGHQFLSLGLDPERIFTRKDQPDIWCACHLFIPCMSPSPA